MNIEHHNQQITKGLTVTISHDSILREFINYDLIGSLRQYYHQYGAPTEAQRISQADRVRVLRTIRP